MKTKKIVAIVLEKGKEVKDLEIDDIVMIRYEPQFISEKVILHKDDIIAVIR